MGLWQRDPSFFFCWICASFFAGKPILLRRTQSVFHRGHEVPFIAPGVFIHSVARRTREHAKRVPSRRGFSFIPWRAGRESTRSVFHRAGGFHSFRGAPGARGHTRRSAWRLIVRRKFSADFKKAFSASCIRISCIFTTNRARKCRAKGPLFCKHPP